MAILSLLNFSVFDLIYEKMGFPGSTASESLQCRRPQFDSWVRKIPWRKDRLPTPVPTGFRGGSDGKESACNTEDLGFIPSLGNSPGGGSHSSTLAWPIPWTEEPGGLQSMGTQRVGQHWVTKPTTAQHEKIGLPWWLSIKESPCGAGDARDVGPIHG